MTMNETCAYFADLARQKAQSAAREPLALLVAAVLGGAYVGMALILALTCTAGLPVGVRPLVAGSVFGIGLILVVLAGGEMVTGHVMYEAFGLNRRTMTWIDAVKLFALVWFGNLIGALVLSILFATAGGGVIYSTGTFLHDLVIKKETTPFLPLLSKAILCNWLVCLAIWMAARLKSETAKMIGMAWCLLAFVACGFEHCVANMTALSLGLFAPHPTGNVLMAAYNLGVVSLGNLIGGSLFVTAAYLVAARAERAALSTAPAAAAKGVRTSDEPGLEPAFG